MKVWIGQNLRNGDGRLAQIPKQTAWPPFKPPS